MVLPFLIPVIGAAIGGGVAYAAGGAIMTGITVGWMVGSWLFPMGGGSLDPKAADLQDVNQSLRGADIPILFGTNRVQSNVILRDNFDTSKKTKKSGGFFGIGGNTQTTGYDYFLDVILHLGIPHNDAGYQAFACWWDSEMVTAKDFAEWSSRVTGGDQPTLSEASAENEISKFLNQDGKGSKTLDYFSAHWSGGTTTTDRWPRIPDLTGESVRWPRHAWVGLQRLDLHEEARIPTLSWEVGPIPGATAAQADPEFLGVQTTDIIPSNVEVTGNNLDVNGNLWFVTDKELFCYSSSGHQLLRTHVDSVKTQVGSQFGIDFTPQFNGRDFACAEPILNGEKVFVCYAVLNGGNDRGHFLIVSPLTGVTSEMTIEGFVWGTYNDTSGTFTSKQVTIRHAHLQREQDPIWVLGYGSNRLSKPIMVPDPQGMRNGAYANGWGSSSVALKVGSSTATWTGYEIPNIEYGFDPGENRHVLIEYENTGAQLNEGIGVMLPKRLDGSIKTTLLWPIMTAVHCAHIDGTNDWEGYADAQYADIRTQGGGVVQWVMDVHSEAELLYDNLLPQNQGDKSWSYTMSPGTDVSTFWTNQDGSRMLPFDDDFKEFSTGSPSGGANFVPRPFWKKESDSRWCFGYFKFSVASADTTQQWVPLGLRGMEYDRESGIMSQIGAGTVVATVVIPTSGQPMEISGNSWTKFGAAILSGSVVVRVDQSQNNSHYVHGSEWGTFDCSASTQKVDLTPPEIIRSILVNTIYGLEYDESLIDQTSYDDAVGYCNSEGFLLSGIYRSSSGRASYLEHLLATYGGYLNWSRGKIKFGFVTGSDTVVRTLDNDHHALRSMSDQEPPIKIAKGSRQDTFNRVQVNFLDRRLAYRKSTVEMSDEVDIQETGVRIREFPGLFVMDEEFASKIAHRTLWSGLYARDVYQGAYGCKDADLEPGDPIWIVDSHHPELESGVRARLVSIAEQAPGFWVYNAIQEDPAFLNDPGFVASETLASPANGLPGAEIPRDFQAFEVPCEHSDPQMLVAWWPQSRPAGARLYLSSASDGTFSLVDEVQAEGIAGWVARELPATDEVVQGVELTFLATSDWSASTPDYSWTYSGEAVTPADRAEGNGMLLIGSEIVGIESMTVVGSNSFKVSRVHRGFGGTHIHAHNSGDTLYWLDAAVLSKPITVGEVGRRYFYKVQPFGFDNGEVDLSSISPKQYDVLGRYFGPQVPPCIHPWIGSSDMRGLDRFAVDSGTDLVLKWEDAARNAGFGFRGFGEGGFGRFTTDTTSHQWAVVITGSGGLVVRTTVADTPAFVYTDSANVADNGAFGGFAISVTPRNDVSSAARSSVRSLTIWRRA